ncbi:poly-beta-1,6 N-acetyl-D-glucosamine export porin PgaA [Luteibacter rhizovicinus]|uniref:poly-beta-1,6 N-acetyl-D-glucosamine export porin PgaA n=1 Tax=Luteibacter rhizovicinus TaxID=242606 RepID=UPI001405177D|nr:poly-beta-1,6 N-acetyl-D-glucosamine export porin PgaA [Luteibacter rhizovicinus]
MSVRSGMHATGLAVAISVALLSTAGAVRATQVREPVSRDELLRRVADERAAGRRFDALKICEDVLARWPDDRDARTLEASLLAELGGSVRAEELARNERSPREAVTMQRLRADVVAHEIRWADAEPVNPRVPYAEPDAAVADLDRLIADKRPDMQDIAARARIDRLVALDKAGRADEAVSVYDEMRANHVTVPAYAQRPVADALLQRHRPQEAVSLLEDSIRQDPGPYDPVETDPHIPLMYAYMESNRTSKAFETIDTLAEREPLWIRSPVTPTPIQNSRKVDADLNAALLREYVGLLDEAHRRLVLMSDEAPANAAIRRELGLSELSRGWPRQASDTLAIAGTLDTNDTGVDLGLINANRTLNDYASVEPSLRNTETLAPRSNRVKEERLSWERERGWQFDITHANGSGSSPDYGDRDAETEATIASPLIDDHWRVLGIARYASAALPEGDVRRERVGLGLRGYARGLEAYVQALPSTDRFVGRTAIEAGAKYAISDHWTVAADWSSAGSDVPLRAQYYGISAKTLDTSVIWRASELTQVKFTASRGRFSDNNKRNAWQAALVQRVYTAPYLTLDGGLELGGSRNTLPDRPYFNPRHDTSWAVTGRLENLLHQFYDRTWRQRIDVAVGQYAQRGYATGWQASARYGQTFEPRAGLSFGWGVGWHNQPYDGKRESRVVLDLTMHWGE